MVRDPQGAAFALFRAADGDPPDGETAPGQWHWCELHTTDLDAAKAFYVDVLGYTLSAMEGNDSYFILHQGGQMRAGLMAVQQPDMPSMWLPYVCVDDVDATVTRASKHGGELLSPLMQSDGVGRHGVLRGADGAALGIITPAER